MLTQLKTSLAATVYMSAQKNSCTGYDQIDAGKSKQRDDGKRPHFKPSLNLSVWMQAF